MNILQWLFGKKEHPAKKHDKHVGCNFGHKEFNKSKRSKEFVEEMNLRFKGGNGRGKVKTTTTTTTKSPDTPPPPPTSQAGVVLLDFDGHVVANTSWNYSGNINCQYSGMTEEEIELIMASIEEDYAPFNVVITRDEAVYNAAPANKRMRCVFTESWEWYGQAGGVAFVGSYSWNDESPCFVFTSLLGYSVKNVKEAASHEIGHTLGLYHQATYDANCVKTSDYNSGCCGEAPIMGVGYYQPDVHWWVGPNSYGCNNIQDDALILKNVLGYRQ